MKSCLKAKLKELEGNAEEVDRIYAKIIEELQRLKSDGESRDVFINVGNRMMRLLYVSQPENLGDAEEKNDKEIFTTACRIPRGAFKLIGRNVDVTAPECYFFDKFQITFGKSIFCDIAIQSNQCCHLEATVRGTSKWQITNHVPNDDHLLSVNERYIGNGETLDLNAGDRIRFGGNKAFDLIYEFQLYSDGSFPTKSDAMSFLEAELKKLREKAEDIYRAIDELKTESEISNEKAEKNTLEVIMSAAAYEMSEKIKIESEGAENQLINNCIKTPEVKREKIDTTALKRKTQAVDVVETEKNPGKVKSTEAFEMSEKIKIESEGSGNQLINNYIKTPVVKREKIDTTALKKKTQAVDVVETEKNPVKVKIEENNNFERIEQINNASGGSIDLKSTWPVVKRQKVDTPRVKIKPEPIEVISID